MLTYLLTYFTASKGASDGLRRAHCRGVSEGRGKTPLVDKFRGLKQYLSHVDDRKGKPEGMQHR